MKLIKKLLKYIGFVLLLPLGYLIIAVITSLITVSTEPSELPTPHTIYLTTNGVHMDIVLPRALLTKNLALQLHQKASDKFVAFGWGDENFYLNIPTWGDLTFKNAFGAMFLKSSTLMHVTRYRSVQKKWIPIHINQDQLKALNDYIAGTFQHTTNNHIIHLPNKGYTSQDDFYKTSKSYKIFVRKITILETRITKANLLCTVFSLFFFAVSAVIVVKRNCLKLLL